MTLETYVKARRESYGITQTTLAKRLGVHTQFVSNFERNRCSLPVKYFKKVSNILAIDLLDMISKRTSDVKNKMIDELF